MEDEVLESAINQMVDEHLETVHSETPEENLMYSPASELIAKWWMGNYS